MSVQRRFTLTFLAALLGLAANQAVYLWSVGARSAAMTALDNAQSRELTLMHLHREVDELRRQITLTTQFRPDSETGLPSPETRRGIQQKLAGIGSRLTDLTVSAEAPGPSRVSELVDLCRQLDQRWRGYYDNLGRNEAIALTHLVQSERLVQEVLNDRIPDLQRQEQQTVESALDQVRAVGAFTARATLTFFAASLVLTIIVSQAFIRYLTRGLQELRTGAELLGSMQLSHRIPVASKDELGALAQAFNEMANKLSGAHSELIRVNRDLAKSEERSRSFIERAVHGIYRTRAEDRFLDVNPALVTMLGYSSAIELLALELPRDVYVEPSECERILTICRRTGAVDGLDVEWKRRDGSRITVRLSGRSFDGSTGGSVMEMIVEDVSERRRLGEQLRHAQKMQAVGRLAGGVSHDFNNLLTVIKGHIGVMLDRLHTDHPLRRRVVEVQRAADRAAVVTGQLLAFSRRQVLEAKVLDLNILVRSMATMVEPLLGEDIRLETRLDPALGQVRADASQLDQALMNLVVNARDAMPHGGTMVIRTANVDLPGSGADATPAHKLDLKPGPYLLLAVTDTGLGMDEQTQRQVFEPFFTTKGPAKGTGLGLSMVYGIARESGGDIAVNSEPGMGTTMTLYLPRIEAVVEPVSDAVAQPKRPHGSETVLLIEDEEAVRELIWDSLAEAGYRVLPTGKASDAERICREYPGDIDLVLTDVVLPETSGPELSRRLVAMRKNMRVLFISGYDSEVIVQRGLDVVDTALVQKPFAPDVLVRKVREVLDSRARGPASRHPASR